VNLKERVNVFDTETTGISRDDEIIQISAAEYVCGELSFHLVRRIPTEGEYIYEPVYE